MSVNLSLFAGAGAQFFDDNGIPLAGGLIYTYAAGSTSPLATYTSNTGLTPLSNPIVLNAAGRIPTGEIWLTAGVAYKFVVYTSTNVLVASYDNINGTYIATNLADTNNPANGDALIGFRQSNANGNLVGAVGRTVHQKLQEYVSVKDFGATGDGTTDDSTSIQNALNCATSLPNACLYFPAGVYKLNSQVTGSIAGTNSLTLKGDGPQQSVILGNNTTGAIAITSTTRNGYVNVTNLKFAPNIDGAGTGFSYIVPAGGNQNSRVVEVTHCHFTPVNYASAYTWNNPLVLTGMYRPFVFDVVCWPGFSATTKQNTILNLNDTYAAEVQSCYFNGAATYGISWSCTVSPEAIMLRNNIINGSDTGVYIVNTVEPLLYITNNHINCYVKGIHLDGVKFGLIQGNLFYTSINPGTATDNYTDIKVLKVEGIDILDNMYRQPSNSINRRHVEIDPTTGTATTIKISDHGFYAKTLVAPIYVGALATKIEITLPTWIQNIDFVSYPTKLVEVNSAATNVSVNQGSTFSLYDNSAASGPNVNTYRYSANPAINDSIGANYWYGNDSAGNLVTYASERVQITSPTAGATYGQRQFFTNQNSVLVNQLSMADGVNIGTPTGSFKGVGTLNVATGIYLNGTAYTNPDYVFEKAYTGKIKKFANNVGADTYVFRTIEETEQYTKDNLALPGFGQEANLDYLGGSEILLARLEEAYLYIFELNKRVKTLEYKDK